MAPIVMVNSIAYRCEWTWSQQPLAYGDKPRRPNLATIGFRHALHPCGIIALVGLEH